MSLSLFEHPFLSGLFGDDVMAAHFQAKADIQAMIAFEIALARAEAEAGVIEKAAAETIAAALAQFVPDIAALKTATAKDGVVIPELVKQLRKAVGGEAAASLHFGATSQDVIDTSLMLRLKAVTELLEKRLAGLISALEKCETAHGEKPLMGYTRMQAAIEITVSDRMHAWLEPLRRHKFRLVEMTKTFPLQFGGAAGTLEKLGNKASNVRAVLARELGLVDTRQWQSQRDRIADFAHVLSLISGSLGKMGQDIALMAELGGQIAITGGGASSAMPHKQNPVAAETLVTLARFNAVQISGLHQSLVHEQERSGAAWALEWMLLPQMALATGAATKTAQALVDSILWIGRE
ncbi:3-carboxy-cis,cis-muconate cycloisomerase [Allorhizobium sp. BGMRC 0089]|uniref:3-carboxy-cis,cis-muconate cycloisomerase n=1 Tax=Allorhizobium sonneratiae TaxID=2934936 RepID=UPI0020339CE4|nr:3-carboxy-cis,cis-muconate cycloisomerase [Allorhizobium sonneratiae]MCM2293244.1 3-carboxy-cis,cis-muconate cycloisomerase [Allorhizobium sonneratiae]